LSWNSLIIPNEAFDVYGVSWRMAVFTGTCTLLGEIGCRWLYSSIRMVAMLRTFISTTILKSRSGLFHGCCWRSIVSS
jgi:hypothetical protein